MREIALRGLGGGHKALVDDEDCERLMAMGAWEIMTAAPGVHYATVRIGWRPNRKGPLKVLMHRVILGATKGQYVDHVDFNGLNNTKANIRLCTQRQNMQHSRKRRTYGGKPTKNRFKGVHQAGKRSKTWLVAYRNKGKYIRLYGFKTEKAADCAYKVITQTLHGAYAQS